VRSSVQSNVLFRRDECVHTDLESRLFGASGCLRIWGVDTAKIQAAFDDAFDQAIIFHGFADYMRDYEVGLFGPGS
jgi:hypothetical protein